MKNFFCAIFFTFFLFNSAHAQQIDKNINNGWAIGIGVIAADNFNTDKTYSPLIFSGINAGGSLQVKYIGNNVLHLVNINYVAGNLKSKQSETGTVKNNFSNIGYSLLFKLKTTSNSFIQCNLGASLDAFYSDRKYAFVINKNTTFESAVSAGFAGLFQHKFSDDFSIIDQINVPLASYLIQPGFGNQNASVKQSMNSKTFASFDAFFRLKNKIGVCKNIDAKQSLSLNYTWDYYHLDKTRIVTNANHAVSLNYYHSL